MVVVLRSTGLVAAVGVIVALPDHLPLLLLREWRFQRDLMELKIWISWLQRVQLGHWGRTHAKGSLGIRC